MLSQESKTPLGASARSVWYLGQKPTDNFGEETVGFALPSFSPDGGGVGLH
jgi:hypothetical protein